MDPELRRMQIQVERMEAMLAQLNREFGPIALMMLGKTDQIIIMPTGLDGIGEQFQVIGSPQGHVPLPPAAGEDHQWKVTESDETTDDVYKVDVVGGEVSTQGKYNAGFAVDDVTGLLASEGYIVLHMYRDSKTRELTNAEIYFSATVEVSTETDQYRALAKIYTDEDGDYQIRQMEYLPICIFEDMAVSNGEFQLVPLSMTGMNPYNLPEP